MRRGTAEGGGPPTLDKGTAVSTSGIQNVAADDVEWHGTRGLLPTTNR
jgi:hypothetical protein